MKLYSGTPYDYAAAAGDLIFTAGACPLDELGDVVASDLDAQVHAALDNLLAVLDREGSSADRILKTTVYVVTEDRERLVRAWRIVEGRLAPARPPSTLVGVSVLGWPGQLFEIEAIARRRGSDPGGV